MEDLNDDRSLAAKPSRKRDARKMRSSGPQASDPQDNQLTHTKKNNETKLRSKRTANQDSRITLPSAKIRKDSRTTRPSTKTRENSRATQPSAKRRKESCEARPSAKTHKDSLRARSSAKPHKDSRATQSNAETRKNLCAIRPRAKQQGAVTTGSLSPDGSTHAPAGEATVACEDGTPTATVAGEATVVGENTTPTATPAGEATVVGDDTASIAIAPDNPQHKNYPEESINCQFCPRVFSRRREQLAHERSVHRQGQRWVCTECPYNCYSRPLLNAHMQSHESEPRFCCEACGQQFRVEVHLERHINRKHKPPPERTHVCPHCSKRFTHGYKLNWHVRVYHELQNCLCQICGKALKTAYGLTVHMRTIHSDAKPHQCTLCDFAAKLEMNLKTHVRTKHPDAHARSRAQPTIYTCSQCSFVTDFKYSFTMHMKVHEKSGSACVQQQTQQSESCK